MPCSGLALHQAHFPINSLELDHMPTPTYTTHSIPEDFIPVGTDFIGGAEALPVKPGTPGQIVLGSDFAGGALTLTAEVGRGEFDKDRAA